MSDSSISADNISDLTRPDTIIWAKLRGYPWWPGRVRHGLGSNFKSSLVPIDALRPFEPNWELFSGKSTATRFRNSLLEARDPEKYRRFETMPREVVDSPSTVQDSSDSRNILPIWLFNHVAAIKRKRGRPPKNPRDYKDIKAVVRRSVLKCPKRPQHVDKHENATLDYVLYCRVKLQKILLRQPLKDHEIPIARKIMDNLEANKIMFDHIKETKIGRVLRLATRRNEFSSDGNFKQVGEYLNNILQSWRLTAETYVQEMGL